jgi:6-phosphogluconolactonase (cycloisomerase 2 family)
MDSRLSAASTPTYACSPKTISPKAGAGHALASSYARSGGACIIPDMDTLVYVGTFSVRRSEGVYIYRMDPESGELVQIGAAPAGENPSFLAVDNEQHVLYAVNEVEDFDGNPGGVVRAFSIDRSTGALRFLGVRSSRAAGPCHLSMDVGGNWVVAN